MTNDSIWSQLSADAAERLKTLRATHARPASVTAVGQRRAASPLASAIGGPAWRPSAETPWPMDHRGFPMMHLARINFTEMTPLDGFPAEGIVKIFISTEAIVFGEDQPHGNGFVVEWHPAPGPGVLAPQPALDEEGDEGTPLVGGDPDIDYDDDDPLAGTVYQDGAALSFSRATMEPGYELPAICAFADAELGALAPFRPRDFRKRAGETLPPVWVGGWPHSVQDSEAGEDDVVLLQVGNGEDETFMFAGDIGCASFLISPEDLAARRFERVRYGSAGY
ncbi:MAG: YwqG family protein [Pseudomonadota bacterium]